MPWKGEKDPYKIWLSEVILQQTRVEQGLGYYERFIAEYPTIHHLAHANDEAVYKHWEGLGYYNRCRNLLATARLVAGEKGGQFPSTYQEILALKGVGPYIASAIATFAYDLPYAVLDGNVFRVLARVYGIDTPIDSATGKKQFTRIAEENLDKQNPALYNQAIMDFGATVCKPMVPLCKECPVKKNCVAFREGLVNHLPVKEKILRRRLRWIYYFLFEVKGKLLVHKRAGKDIWNNLYEFYPFESPEEIEWNEQRLKTWLNEQLGVKKFKLEHRSALQSQQLTHQTIKGRFFRITLPAVPEPLAHYQPVNEKEMQRLAFPRFINRYLDSGR